MKDVSAGHKHRPCRLSDRYAGRAAFCATHGSTLPTSRRGFRSRTTAALDWDALGDCDYLYVSHLHKDHFDAQLLTEHVNKDAVVLLPDYPVPDLKNALQTLGFHRFFETTDSHVHRLSGPRGELDIMVIALRAPADGPIGDSGLVVSDGVTTAFNMNDARAGRPRRVDLRVRPRRCAHAAVFRRHLVPDGLRHAGTR